MTAVGAAGCPLMLPTMIRRDFWACAIAALGKASPGVAPRAFELIKMGADPRQVVLPTLLDELAAIDYQIALILDDYHLVENRAVHEQVGFLVERMPQTFRLVIATRSDPALPLARLRAAASCWSCGPRSCAFRPATPRTCLTACSV
jgi:ATP/maltotriose-dependent transcriptional regulator MalT